MPVTTTVPPTIPAPPALNAPPPSTARDAFVRAAPESPEIALPVEAAPSSPAPPKLAAINGAAKKPAAPTTVTPPMINATFIGLFISCFPFLSCSHCVLFEEVDKAVPRRRHLRYLDDQKAHQLPRNLNQPRQLNCQGKAAPPRRSRLLQTSKAPASVCSASLLLSLP